MHSFPFHMGFPRLGLLRRQQEQVRILQLTFPCVREGGHGYAIYDPMIGRPAYVDDVRRDHIAGGVEAWEDLRLPDGSDCHLRGHDAGVGVGASDLGMKVC